MEALKKIVVVLLVLVFPLQAVGQDDVSFILSEQACDERLREVINGVGTDSELTQDTAKSLMAACASGDLTQDISVQIMLMLFGEQVTHGLDITKFIASLFTSFTGGAQVNYDEDEAQRLANMFPAFQQVVLYMNWVFVGIFVLFLILRMFMMLMRLNADQDREEFKKGLSQDISSWFFNGALLSPITGVLSGIQMILITGLVCSVMLAKTVVTLFYVGNGGFTLLETISNEAQPAMISHASNNIAYHLCSIVSKDEMVESISSVSGTNFEALAADEYFQCVNGSEGITYNANRKYSPSETVFSNSETSTLTTFQSTYDIGLERRLHACYEEFGGENEYNKLPEPRDCGEVILKAPMGASVKPEDSPVLRELERVFLNTDYQQKLFEQALLMYEYDCRQDGTSSAMRCLSQTAVENGLVYDISQNTVTGEDQLISIPKGLGEMTKGELIANFELLTEKITIHLSNNIQSVASAFMNELTEDESSDVTKLLAIDKEVEKIKNQIERGVWLSSVAFVSDIGKAIDKEIINKITEYAYSVKSNVIEDQIRDAGNMIPGVDIKSPLSLVAYAGITLDGATAGEYVRDKATSILIPTFNIYKSYKQCWENTIFCDKVSINPFSQVVDLGVTAFDSAVNTGVIAVLVRNFAKATEDFGGSTFARKFSSISDVAARASKVQIFDMYITIQFVYMLFGAILALYIPLIPVYVLLSKLVSWVKDLVGVTLGLQLDLATSPIGEYENRALSVEVRKAFSSLFVLGAHFLFIGVGVMMCFIMFSFFMGLNAIVVGLVLDIFGVTRVTSLLESMLAALIADTLIIFIIYSEVKVSASMIKKIPDALAEQFDIHIDQDETIVQKFETVIKGQIIPEVRKFMG